jgi:hypothetical protein
VYGAPGPTSAAKPRPRGRLGRRLITATAISAVLAGSAAVVGVANADEPLVARFDYTLHDRTTVDHRGAVTNLNPSWEHVHPSGWWVDLDACVSSPREIITSHRWEIELPDELKVVEVPPDRCGVEVRIDAPQGSYPVTLTVNDSEGREDTTTGTLTIKDHVIVSLGDSVASGEGNPDVPATEGELRWDNTKCHRSGWTSPAQAARRIEESDRHSTVTFISLACSGASIWEGIVGKYAGADPRNNDGTWNDDLLDPQIIAANKVLCVGGYGNCYEKDEPLRKIDALLLTVGANDLHFSTIVYECAHPLDNPCYSRAVSDTVNRLENDLPELPTRLDYMSDMLDTWLDYNQLIYPMYFDPTFNEGGFTCEEMIFPGPINGSISNEEAQWAHREVIGPLNTNIMTAAQRANNLGRRWNVVRMAPRFVTNGYCTDDAHRAIVRYDESQLVLNGGDTGTMHPNWRGHQFYEEEILPRLRDTLPA